MKFLHYAHEGVRILEEGNAIIIPAYENPNTNLLMETIIQIFMKRNPGYRVSIKTKEDLFDKKEWN